MTKKRERCIEMVIDELDQEINRLQEIKDKIRQYEKEEELQYNYNSEAWQDSEKGETSEEAMDLMESAIDKLIDALEDLESI